MANYRIENGRFVNTATGLPQAPSTDIIATPKPIYETRLKTEEYQAFANQKSKEFQDLFYKEQEGRKGSFQSKAKLDQRYYTAKETAKRQLEVGSDAVILGRIQKYRENYFTQGQQRQVEDFNKQTEVLFETGKKQTQKQIDEARAQFEYRVQVGSYTEISRYDGGKREILGYSYKTPEQISKQVQADIKKQEEQFKIDWENQGGVYSDYNGNLMSSMLSPGKIGSGFVKVGTPTDTDQKVLASRAADIRNQIDTQKNVWANAGGTYINPFGNFVSSSLSQTQLNKDIKVTASQPDYFSQYNKGLLPFANVVTQGKPYVGAYVKIANPNETDLSLIQSRAQPILEEAKIGYTKSYFNALANPVYETIELTPEQIAYNNQVLSPKEILAQKKPIDQWLPDSAANGVRVQKETYDFLSNDPFLDKYVWGKTNNIPYAIASVAGTGEFVKSLGGELFRNYVLQLKASPASVGAVPIGMQDAPIYNQTFTRQQIVASSEFSYTTGRLLTGVAGYFTPAAPAFAAFDIAQARTPMEVIEPLLMVGATTAVLKGGFKLMQYAPLKASALLGGSITKTGTILSYSSKIPQYLEYGSKIGQYAAPVALGAYGAYSFAQATPYLYSSDKLVAREAERRLFVSLGAGYVGGLGGDYLGTELFEKNLNWRIGRETILQGGSGLGKLTAQQKVAVNDLYSRAYGKQLPGNVDPFTPIKEYTSANLDVFGNFSKKQQKALTRITDQTIKEFGDSLYIGGSSQVPSQITGKAYKKAGDIDVFLGSKEFAMKLTENINAAKLKGVTAKATYGDDLLFEGAAHVNLFKKGKALEQEFVNIHYELGRTTQQLKLFGEPFQSTKGAFVSNPSGTKLFNIREQLRAKIEGYYFGSRAKDLVDIEGIMLGTEKAAKLYKQYKKTNVWLDERGTFTGWENVQLSGFIYKTNKRIDLSPTQKTKAVVDYTNKLIDGMFAKEKPSYVSGLKGTIKQDAYSPYTNYSTPKSTQLFAPYYAPSKKDSYYSTAYSNYKPTAYAGTYAPTYSAKYAAQYNATYNPKYTPEYAGTYSPTYKGTYNAIYKPKYNPSYAPAYNPTYKPNYNPKYAPGYKPKYTPGYTPGYYPPNKPPKIPPTYRSKDQRESKEEKKFRKAMTRGETILFKPTNIENLILPIKTDWLKAIGYSKKKAKIQTIGLLPNERKGSKQIAGLLGIKF